MCGIVGIYNLKNQVPIEVPTLKSMLAAIRHRGPDEFGIYTDAQIGLGNARLSIIDLSTGSQPIANEDETLWIVFNGEIFNYVELRPELEARGHHFRTASDTEVIVHLYEELGPDCLQHFIGQFAIAIWDKRRRELFLARDRLGIRPLYYTMANGALIFGSEIKALLSTGQVRAEIDPVSLDQIFTFWSTLTPRTIFREVYEIPPGYYALARDGQFTVHRYWSLNFPPAGEEDTRPEAEVTAELRELLVDATRIRLRADVPVGAYLSGGLDSSTITALIRHYTNNYLKTFSIAFSDPDFDERQYQERMSNFLHTDHSRVECTHADIGRVFPEVIWHTETPILRTSPAPMFLLSQLVRENNIKVVLTGEGADEFLGGYNIFKEAKVRRFWARQPESKLRAMLLCRLYPYVPQLSAGGAYTEAFFRQGLTDTTNPVYSHQIRWRNTARLKRLLSTGVRVATAGYDPVDEFAATLDGHFAGWSGLAQAQYIEVSIFMSEYLLSSQGDRMLAAHSVEGRFPFLDHRVIEFCSRIPPHLKIRGLNEKYILKKSVSDLLPADVCQRPKRPYRAPIHRSFFPADGVLPYVEELLSSEAVAAAGYFDPQAVVRLAKKCRQGTLISESDDMALAGVLSTQLVHRLFVEDFAVPPGNDLYPLKLCTG
ncbi:MAG: asparagine synthase (glutamine-hydrolyzing) [Anaerolineae bacterium]|jgi:asparagine synthase (glutamine-hydrolysing)|nr:asparagine synthase (glutamine-hydrolyzing) [Anaerolineae bacterium]MDH7473285.1 asparagine synthase (glutamine-hydrolyzing) [Anaerolineae bacterium]